MKTYGEIDEDVLKQMDMCRPNGELSALMGDNHLGYSMPIGGVIGYKDIVSVSGVGSDIACLDSETEFLTETGWKKISEYSVGDKVLQYEIHSNGSSFVSPLAYIHNKDENIFYHIHHIRGLDMMVTKNHKMIYWPGYKGRGSEKYKIEIADDLVEHHNKLTKGIAGRIRTTFDYQSSSSLSLTDDLLRVIIMVCADG